MSSDTVGSNKFKPLPKQKDFIMSTADQVLLSGSFGAGKSRVGCEKGYYLNMKYAGNRGLIVRKHFSDVRTSTISQTLLEEVIPDSHIVDHNKGEHVIKHYTGVTDPEGEPVISEVHYHGLDAGDGNKDDIPRKIGSTAYGWIFVDEGSELTENEWAQLQGRLRYKGRKQGGKYFKVPFRQIFTATNPASQNHWMYKTFFEGANEKHGQSYALRMNVEDNPYNPDEYVDRLRQNLSGMNYDRYFLGKWVGSEGMIYEDWVPDENIVSPDQLADPDRRFGEWEITNQREWNTGNESVWIVPPEEWQIYRSIDFGYNNPFVCLWGARSPDDELVIFRELYQKEMLVEDAADMILKNDVQDRSIEQSFADHDAEGKAVLDRYGVSTVNAKKEVQAGIQAVKSRLQRDERDKCRLYFMDKARIHKRDEQLRIEDRPLRTTEEIPSYKWKSNDEEKPVKEDDHGVDALRYLVHSIDEGRSMTVEEMQEWSTLINDAF